MEFVWIENDVRTFRFQHGRMMPNEHVNDNRCYTLNFVVMHEDLSKYYKLFAHTIWVNSWMGKAGGMTG